VEPDRDLGASDSNSLRWEHRDRWSRRALRPHGDRFMTAKISLLAALVTVTGCLPGGPGTSDDPPAWTPMAEPRRAMARCAARRTGDLRGRRMAGWSAASSSSCSGRRPRRRRWRAILTERGGRPRTPRPRWRVRPLRDPDDAYTSTSTRRESPRRRPRRRRSRVRGSYIPLSLRTATATSLSELYAAFGLTLD